MSRPRTSGAPRSYPVSEEAFEVEESSAARVFGHLGSAIEEPPPTDDEELGVSPPLVVQEGWWEQEAREDETLTGDPPADGEEGAEEVDTARQDLVSEAVTRLHEDPDTPRGGGDPLKEAPPSDASGDERDAKVGALLGGIRPSRPPASVEIPRCGVCNRVHEESLEAAQAEGWYVAGAEAVCERCRAAGWRL